jgi:signal transduction histidine kinase
LDSKLHPEIPSLIYFRLGLTLVGLISLVLFFIPIPYLKNKRYLMLFGICLYMELATAMILGLVRADPVYMGGFCILVILVPIFPFRKQETMILLGAACVLFLIVGLASNMSAKSWEEMYGWINFMSSLVISIITAFVLDGIRKQNYRNNCTIHQINEELQATSVELRSINEELEDAAIELSKKNEELRQVAQEEAIINEELQEANELKSKLLSMAAHDLRGPLQIILLHAGDLTQVDADNPDPFMLKRLGKAAEKISMNADKMEKLIEHTLETAVIDSGKLKLDRTPVDLGELAGFVIRHCAPLAEKKNQSIVFKGGEGYIVDADNVRLEQVMDNIVRNAVKFSPPGKTIWVTVDRDNTLVTFEVRDEGPGLNDDDKKNLFKEFQRLSARPTGGETSTGLGLSISMKLVKLHGGNIRVESDPGKGSTFIVELPRGVSEKPAKPVRTRKYG